MTDEIVPERGSFLIQMEDGTVVYLHVPNMTPQNFHELAAHMHSLTEACQNKAFQREDLVWPVTVVRGLEEGEKAH